MLFIHAHVPNPPDPHLPMIYRYPTPLIFCLQFRTLRSAGLCPPLSSSGPGLRGKLHQPEC